MAIYNLYSFYPTPAMKTKLYKKKVKLNILELIDTNDSSIFRNLSLISINL